MIKVALVRGSYLNYYEGQNYIFRNQIRLTGISSRSPINHTLPFPSIKLLSLADIPFPKRLLKIIANRTLGDSQILFGLESYASHFDLFHTADPHYYYSYQLAKLRAANKIQVLISTSWETIPFNNETVLRKKQIKDYARRYMDLFICYTEKAKEALIIEGVKPERIRVVRLGVDLKRFHPSPQTENRPLTILFIGRLVEEKGILDLYNALLPIAQSGIKLQVVGDGPLKQALVHKIERDGLTNQVSVCTIDYLKIHHAYRQADILVLPSKKTKNWEEQYGMVLVEAMACGLPVVAYDSGAIGEVLGEAGLLVREGDLGGLTSAIKRLVEDKTLRQKIGTMGRRRALAKFDKNKTSSNIEKIYRQLYEKNNRRHLDQK